eukprot:3269785-Ditylum_brightwellii.AAC.1
MWRKLVKFSKERFTINEEQLGGQAEHDTNTLTLIEESKNDICHCSHKSLINFDNDAAMCYDIIVPNITNFVGQKKGLNRNLIFVHALTLAEAKFKLKTALGGRGAQIPHNMAHY